MATSSVIWLERLTIGEFALHILEKRFPEWRNSSNEPVAGIIVLGGTFDGQKFPGARVQVAIKLAQRFPNAKVVFSGMEETAGAGGADAAQVFMAAGISPSRIVIEGRSRSTAENAEFSRAMIQPGRLSRWILVTSAFHMPRAVGAFRAARFAVEAYPVEYLSASPTQEASVVFKEIIGLAYYRLTERSDAWLPSP
ncbi:MAG: YdcF family protein [Methylocystis sp.]|nr:YdcF family protein [Methylocystis sp.]